ncbi:MAG: hypothetical protein IKR85_08130 [Clostridia bacterium]|nr:hypothetical protein [Clostridia bacterium]
MKRFICLLLALALLGAAIALLYTDLVYQLFDRQKVDALLSEHTPDAGAQAAQALDAPNTGEAEDIDEATGLEKLGLRYFPMYKRIYDFAAKNVFKINDMQGTKGDFESFSGIEDDLKEIYGRQNFWGELINLLIIALISIPVYALVRFLGYNEMYKMSDEAFALARPFARGLVCLACAVVSVTATWFLYHSVVYELAYKKLMELIASADMSRFGQIASNAVFYLAVLAVALLIVKAVVFRGSAIKSVLTAALRTLVFVVLFALINASLKIQGIRWPIFVFALAFLLVVGMIDLLIEPSND